MNDKKILVVEGNIGSGKSTFLTKIKMYLDAHIIYEPHKKWQDISGDNLLNYYYQDPFRWAYTFQTYAFVTKVLEQEQNIKCSNKNLFIIERSVFSDKYCFAKSCFELNLMNSMEWNLYTAWYSLLINKHIIKPTGFIYLKTDPHVCLDRIFKRKRAEESVVSIEYLTKLHEKHEGWLVDKNNIEAFLEDIPVLVLDCNNDFEDNISEQKKLFDKVVDFFQLTKLSYDNLKIL